MKKFYLSLVAMLLTCFSAFATDYKIDETKVITADANALDGVTAVVTDIAGAKTWAAFSGGDGQDINANCTSVLAWSSMSQYSYIKFFAVEGQADDVYYIKCVNAEGNFYVPNGGWHDKSGCMNVTGNGGGLFIGGLAGQNGQDAPNGALWKVAKTAEGYTLYNIGKERYAVPGVGVTATETAVKLYSEFVVYDAEAEGIFSGRMSNDRANWAGATGVYGGGAERYNGGGQPEGDIMVQTIENLPAGIYEVKFNAISNVARDLDVTIYAGEGIAYAFANDATQELTVGTKAALADTDFTAGEVTLTATVNEDGVLKYGMANHKAGSQWAVAKAISLVRTGNLPVTITANNGMKYTLLSENLFVNGSFEEGVAGWKGVGYNTDADASNFGLHTEGGYDGGAYITTNAAGAGAATSIRQAVALEEGKLYYFQVYTSGKAPAANNYNYNALFKMTDATTENGVLKAFEWPQGAEKETTEWSLTDYAFTATSPYVGVRMSWNANSNFDGFALYEVEEAGIDLDMYKASAIAGLPVADESLFTPSAESIEAITAAIQAATTVEEVDAAAATEPTIPALSGQWQIKNANGEVYLGEAVLTATAIATTFEKVDGGFYIKVGDKYVNMKGDNNWNMSASETATTAWNFNLADGKYTIQGPKGLIGSDNVNDGSATYGDKKTTATDKNIFWTIEEYVEAGAWDGTISTNLEEKVLKDRDDIEGMTITFNGAKTIEIDEYGYLALAENEDGWPLLKVWATMFGSTYSIDGETITLNGWVNYEDVAADPGTADPQALLAKVKKVAKAPAADSWYVQDYGAFIIDGVAADEYGYLDDIAVKHEEQGGWDGTVTTSLDEATITSIADFNNMTITLNGAKSIAILDEEECQFLALQNEDGSELYGIWAPTMGSTYTIEGNTITIGGFMPWEGATIDIPVGTTKLYIEDYGTLAIDGEGEYLPTMELNANITGPAEPFAFEVINNNVKVKNNSSEEAETVSIRFQIDSEYDVAVGEGVPTLTANGEEQGEATLSVVDGIGLITFNAAPAAKDGEFTAAGTYTLIIPEGTFVDANGAPNELFGASWVILEKVPVLADGDYYIQENTSGLYLSNGAYWGTRSVLSDNGICYKAVLGESGKYTLKSGIKGDAKALRPSDGFNDQSGEWEIIAAENGGVYMFNGTKYFTRVEGSAIPDFTENKDEASVWNFITPEERMASLAEATAENPVDATFLIKGADFLNGDIANNAWSKNKVGGDNGSGNTLINNTNCEQWNAGAVDVNQTLTNIPNGIYQLKAFGYVRQNGATTASADAYENGEETPAYLYANEAQTQLKSIFAEAYTETKPSFATVTSTAGNTYYIANGQNTAAVCFEDGRYLTETIEVEVTDGTLKIGVKCDGVEWLVFDNFRLTYLGEPPFYTDVVVWPTLDQVNVHFNAQTAEPTYEAPVNLETADGELVEENITVKLGAEFGDVKFCFSKPLEYGDYVIVINPGSMTFMYSHEGCAEEIRIPFTVDEKATGINEINVNTVNQIYTLSGVRVNKAQKGIYIINGKKVVIK